MTPRVGGSVSPEFNQGVWLVLAEFLVPALFAAGDVSSGDLDRVLGGIRGNPMARAALVDAFVDAELRAQEVSLATYLGADRDRVACGVSGDGSTVVGFSSATEHTEAFRWRAHTGMQGLGYMPGGISSCHLASRSGPPSSMTTRTDRTWRSLVGEGSSTFRRRSPRT